MAKSPTWMTQALALFAALLGLAGVAQATAGFDCTIDDAHVSFTAGGYGPRGIPAPVQGFDGTLQVKLPWTHDALKSIPLSQHLMQSWWEGSELKLLVYRETEGAAPFASVKLVINTRQTEEEDGYAGTYELTVTNLDPAVDKTETVSGPVTCGGE